MYGSRIVISHPCPKPAYIDRPGKNALEVAEMGRRSTRIEYDTQILSEKWITWRWDNSDKRSAAPITWIIITSYNKLGIERNRILRYQGSNIVEVYKRIFAAKCSE